MHAFFKDFRFKRSAFLISGIVVLLIIFANIGFTEQETESSSVDSFRYVVMGDSRGITKSINESTLRNLLANVKALSPAPEFILFTGDQINGNTDITGELANWKNVVDDYFPINRYYTALGNHEHDETLFSNAFYYLPNEQLDGYQRSTYYFDFGNSRFITLNSDRKDANGNYIVSSRQRAWLEKLLKTSPKTHNFVQLHVPAYPNSNHYLRSLDANPAERDALWDIFSRYNVSVVYVGHEHNYNRRYVDQKFNGNGYQFKNPIYQLTIGGAGAPLYGVVKNDFQVKVMKAVYHYLVVDVAGTKATFKAYDENNNLIDEFVIERSAPVASNKQIFEAEDAILANGAKTNNNHSGYIGTGFVDGYWLQDASTTFTVNAPKEGKYSVVLRYANGASSEKNLSVLVNGQNAVQTKLASTNDWKAWGDRAELLTLKEGKNTIAYNYSSSDSGNVNIDFIEVDFGVTEPSIPPIPTVTASSTPVVTVTPVVTTTPIVIETPEPTPTPEATPTATPVVTPSPVVTATPVATTEPSPTTTPKVTPSPVYVLNGGFEQGSSNWRGWNPKGFSKSFGVDGKDVYSGSKKLYFWNSRAYVQSLAQQLSKVPNGKYELSAWVKINAPTDFPEIARMEAWNYRGKPVTLSFGEQVGYANYRLPVQVQNGKLQIRFYVKAKANTTIQIDQVELIPVVKVDSLK